MDEALRIDAETDTNFWSEAVKKEMSKAQVAYEEVEQSRVSHPKKCEQTKSQS